jgi:hypothetical protein
LLRNALLQFCEVAPNECGRFVLTYPNPIFFFLRL